MSSQDKTESTTRGTEASAGSSGGSKSKNGKYNLRRKTLVVRKETEERLVSPKAPKPKSRPPPLSKYRRRAANSRERGRMQEINIAFQDLQTVLPLHCLPETEPKGGITKITTLRLAVNYIAALRGVLGEDVPSSDSSLSLAGTAGQSEEKGVVAENTTEKSETSTDVNETIITERSQMTSPVISEQCEVEMDAQSINLLNDPSGVSSVREKEQCAKTVSSGEHDQQVDGSANQTVPDLDNPQASDSTSSVQFMEDFSAYPTESSVQGFTFTQRVTDECQTQMQYNTLYRDMETDLNADLNIHKSLANNPNLDMIVSSEAVDVVKGPDIESNENVSTTEDNEMNLNVDANNNLRNFDPSSLPFQSSDGAYREAPQYPDSDMVGAGLSWVDPTVQAITLDTRYAVDTKDTEMDIDTELLVYPDIIRAVINDQFD